MKPVRRILSSGWGGGLPAEVAAEGEQVEIGTVSIASAPEIRGLKVQRLESAINSGMAMK
jgi:hypothetical protein